MYDPAKTRELVKRAGVPAYMVAAAMQMPQSSLSDLMDERRKGEYDPAVGTVERMAAGLNSLGVKCTLNDFVSGDPFPKAHRPDLMKTKTMAQKKRGLHRG